MEKSRKNKTKILYSDIGYKGCFCLMCLNGFTNHNIKQPEKKHVKFAN